MTTKTDSMENRMALIRQMAISGPILNCMNSMATRPPMVVRELEELTHSRIDPALIAEAWKSIVIKDRISIPKLRQFVQDAHQAGFMKEVPDIGGLVVPEAAEEQLTMAKEAGGR